MRKRVSRCLSAVVVGAAMSLGASAVAADQPWSHLGRTATKAEVAAWDIDVRADFKGLPAGKGSVDEGMEVWEGKCASCHGIFGESNEVFTPIIGGTTPEDIENGRVASLRDPNYPQRTTMMKVSQVSTLWDYINRAMPWNAPKSLSANEVFAVVAYLLNMAGVVEDDFVLSPETMAQAQARLPNRNGTVDYDGLWLANGQPDVQGSDCMKDCATEIDIRSFLPDYARNAHGNLAEQNRVVGAVRGADTFKPAPKSLDETRELAGKPVLAADGAGKTDDESPEMMALAGKSNCLACHGVDRKLVGPAFVDIAKKYAGNDGAPDLLAKRVREGAQGTWGPVPMPANPLVSDADAKRLVKWILGR
ncbi:MAG: c-type cytochrome [Burkholderiaceae bacterium]